MTLPLKVNEALKGLSSLPVLMQESFSGGGSVATGLPLPHLPSPVPNKPGGFRGRKATLKLKPGQSRSGTV